MRSSGWESKYGHAMEAYRPIPDDDGGEVRRRRRLAVGLLLAASGVAAVLAPAAPRVPWVGLGALVFGDDGFPPDVESVTLAPTTKSENAAKAAACADCDCFRDV